MGIKNIYCFVIFSIFASEIHGTCRPLYYEQLDDAIKNCTEITLGDFAVPERTTLNLTLLPNTRITFNGTVYFAYSMGWSGPLVHVSGTGLYFQSVLGQGMFEGFGQFYWDGMGGWGSTKPQFFDIQVTDSYFNGLKIHNAPEGFINLRNSNNVTLNGTILDNSEADPNGIYGPDRAGHNTDGYVISNSSNILISHSSVLNQDDCVAIQSGENITVWRVACYGSHGLSISAGHSLDNYKLNTVRNVFINDSLVVGGSQAIHIKTRVDGGEGIIENVTYHIIEFSDQDNYTINIQQNYQNRPPSNSTRGPVAARGNIPIRGLTFSKIVPSVNNTDYAAVYINCADGACSDWEWSDIDIENSPSRKNWCNFEPQGFTC